ncbi:MAG: AAA family ATPase [Bdellovibrionales bacterium]|nr:AAA family ATPase [Bdellovibrionales bacterium]
MYSRLLALPKKSFFLFGPRGTGKSVWLKQHLSFADLSINLLKSKEYLQYKKNPSLLEQEVSALKKRKAWIVIDEVQKCPELLDEVHALLFESKNNYRFALSGSSARQLKRSQANMLAGRALSKKMFPLSRLEIGKNFKLQEILCYGQLPLSVTESNIANKIEFLDAYIETYLKEEIQQEALVRNLNNFYRFLSIAALMNGQVLNISNIARDVGVARSTVQGYFSILEDTLLAWYLPAYRNKAKVKEIAHTKFYLFDCGVQRALAGLHRDKPSINEIGFLFETFILNEFRAINSWMSHGARFFYWRTESGNEVDLIWKKGHQSIGFEIKSTYVWKEKFNKGLNVLLNSGDIHKAFGVYRGHRILKVGKVTVLPYTRAIEMVFQGHFKSS